MPDPSRHPAAPTLADRLLALADFCRGRNLPYHGETARLAARQLAGPPSRAILREMTCRPRPAPPAAARVAARPLPAGVSAKLTLLSNLCPARVEPDPGGGFVVLAPGREVEDLATGDRFALCGRGSTPAAAIEADWHHVTTLAERHALVLRHGADESRYWRWDDHALRFVRRSLLAMDEI